MISKLGMGRDILRLKIQSLGWTLSLVLLAVLTLEVGSYNTASYDDGSNQNGDSSLCRVIRGKRNKLVESFTSQYTATSSYCDITDHCTNVTCAAEFSRGKVNAGLVLRLCETDPELDYWVDIPGQWDEPWEHTFSSKDLSGQVQRVEVGNHNGTSNSTKPTRWFIQVIFSITPGRIQQTRASKYISLWSALQICQSEVETSCRNTTLIDFPRLPQNQVCYFDDEPSSLPEDNGENAPVSSSRSSRNANANAWNPQELHRSGAEKASKFENGRLPAAPGEPCDLENLFKGCGSGSTCVAKSDGSGICDCLPGYTVTSSTSLCVLRPPSSPEPLGPSDSSESDSRSYSSAIGAISSILILIAIAAVIFFGTKYHYFERIRQRLPVIRCWPFRRHQPWEDNLTMVNPLGPPDDDDPLLL